MKLSQQLGLFLLATAVGNASVLCFWSDSTSLRNSAPSPKHINLTQVVNLEPLLGLSKSTEISQTFTLTNETTKELNLEKPVLGCGCSAAVLDATRLSPGDTAQLSVTVKIPAGFDGLKSVTTTVSAESGEKWALQLNIPVVSRVIVPRRIAMKVDDLPSVADVRVQVRVRQAEELEIDPLRFESSSPDLRVSVVRTADTEKTTSNGVFYIIREYDCRLELLSIKARLPQIVWKFDGSAFQTAVDFIEVFPVTITPKRIILNNIQAKGIEITLGFPNDSYSAKLLKCPPSLSPNDYEAQLTKETPTMKFLRNSEVDIKAVEDVVFQVFCNDRPHSAVKSVVVSVTSQ